MDRFDSEYKIRTDNLILPIFRKKLMLKGYKLFPNSGAFLLYDLTTHFYKIRLNFKKNYCNFFLSNGLGYFFYRHGNSDFYKKGIKGSLILKKLKLSIWLDITKPDINLIFLNTHFFFKNFSLNCMSSVGSVWTYIKYLKGHREMNMAPFIQSTDFKSFLFFEKKKNFKFRYKKRITPRYELLTRDVNIILNLPKAHSTIKYTNNNSKNSKTNISISLNYLNYILCFKNTLSFFINFNLLIKYKLLSISLN